MSKMELVQIMQILSSTNVGLDRMLQDEMKSKLIMQTWYNCIGDLDYNLVLAAVQKLMITNPYPPTIHEIRKAALSVTDNFNDDSTVLWNEAYKMICNGTYMTQEEFDRHSPIVKKFFGDVAGVKALSMTDIQTVTTVTRGQFLKQIEVLKERENQDRMLPLKLKETISRLTGNIGNVLEITDNKVN